MVRAKSSKPVTFDTITPEGAILYHKFKQRGYSTVAEMIRDVNSEISNEQWSKLFNGRTLQTNKTQYTRPDIRQLLIMMYELCLEPEEMRDILIMRDEIHLSKLVDRASYNSEEILLIEKYRELGNDKAKRKIIMDLLNTLARG